MSDIVRHAMKVPNSKALLAAVREIIGELIRRSAYPVKKDAGALMLAVDEAMANIMEHAYGEGRGEIDLELSADGESFSAVLRDQGPPFDPGSVRAPDLKAHVKSGRRHGLGLFLIRSIMDEVNYTYSERGGNELRLVRFAQRKRG